jgi:hypothetical protein
MAQSSERASGRDDCDDPAPAWRIGIPVDGARVQTAAISVAIAAGLLIGGVGGLGIAVAVADTEQQSDGRGGGPEKSPGTRDDDGKPDKPDKPEPEKADKPEKPKPNDGKDEPGKDEPDGEDEPGGKDDQGGKDEPGGKDDEHGAWPHRPGHWHGHWHGHGPRPGHGHGEHPGGPGGWPPKDHEWPDGSWKPDWPCDEPDPPGNPGNPGKPDPPSSGGGGNGGNGGRPDPPQSPQAPSEPTPSEPGALPAAGGGLAPTVGVPALLAPIAPPVMIVPRLPIGGPARSAPPEVAAPAAPPVARPPAPPRPANPPPATASSTGMNRLPESFRVGYPEYLRSAQLAEVAGLALPGVAGIVALTAVGGLVGYRQAKAGHAVRSAGTARFLQ